MTQSSAAELVERLTALTPDHPSPGILFRDLTTTLADPVALRAITDDFAAAFAGRFDLVAGIEARGFLLAGALAYATGTGVVSVRKKGKLPPPTVSASYALEYGEAEIELRPGLWADGTRVLVVDDVLATGGTAEATCELVERVGGVVVGLGVAIELAGLGGRARLTGREVHAITRA